MDEEAAKRARRRRTKQERRRIVEESFAPGVSVARLAAGAQGQREPDLSLA
jgi:transposase-like protein